MPTASHDAVLAIARADEVRAWQEYAATLRAVPLDLYVETERRAWSRLVKQRAVIAHRRERVELERAVF